MRRVVAILFAAAAWVKLFSQSTIQFNHYTAEQGLCDNSVNDIVQDERGFTWLATANGLSRFDGVQFRNYFRGGPFTKIPGNTVYLVKKWKDNFLVIATDNGLGIVNTSNGQYKHLLIPSEKEISSHANNFQGLAITVKNDIIAGSYTGVYVFNSDLQLVAKKEAGFKPADIGKKRIYFSLDIYTLQSGDAMVTTTDGLLLYDHRQKLIYPINKHNNPSYRQFGSHFSRWPDHIFGIDRHNRLFCIDYRETKDQLRVFDLNSVTTSVASISINPSSEFNWSTKMSFHGDSMFSLNSAHGGFYLFHYDPGSSRVTMKSEKILTGIVGSKLFLDAESRWWACTFTGLFSQSLIRQQFNNLDLSGYFDNRNLTAGVAGIYRYKKKLYVGLESANEGILVFDEKDRFLRKIDLGELHRECNVNWNIDKWSEDTLVVGTQGGLVLLNTNNYQVKRINYPGWPSPANQRPIPVNYTDSHGTRWIGLGSSNGVMAFYPKTGTWKHFSPRDKDAAFKLRHPTGIAEDRDGNIWMIHRGEVGLTRWNYLTESFDTVIRRFEQLNAEATDITCLASDDEGNLWLGLRNGSVIRWHLKTNQLQTFRFQSSWQTDEVVALYTGQRGMLWIAFRHSLGLLDIHTGMIKSFTGANGLPDNSASIRNFYYDPLTRTLMLGFDNSFTRFDPYPILYKDVATNIFITEINLLNDTSQTDPQQTVRLRYRQNDLAIHFSAIDYENGQQNSYEYRLYKNEKSPWINIGHQQSINLNNLPAGKYIFQVRRASSIPDNKEQIAGASIIVIPPFYQTVWFYALCIIIVLAFAYVAYRWRIQQLVGLQQMRNSISSDLHDDIGARLTNIQLLSALGEQKLEHPEEVSSYLHRIVGEVQSSGEALDDIVWSINSKNDSGDELAARMRRYVAEVFEPNQIVHHMMVDDNFSVIKFSMEKRRDFYLVFKEALNNILKHSGASAVDIALQIRNDNVMMQIADNGKGFDTNQTTSRNGLKNMRKRIGKWSGELIVESVIGKGTKLHIKMPLNRSSLKRTILKRLHLQ